MSTTLILPGEQSAEFDPDEIRDKLERQVGLIIHGGYLGEQPTSVIDMSEGNATVIREGSGDTSVFG